MNGKPYDIDENDLHAWVDGQLEGERCAAVEAAVAADDRLAALASAYRAQNDEIRALFGDVARDPVPRHLRPHRIAARQGRKRWLVPLAASVVWLAIGLAGGWLAHERLGGGGAIEDATRHVASRAVSAYRSFSGPTFIGSIHVSGMLNPSRIIAQYAVCFSIDWNVNGSFSR